jgi:anti-anti-sigma factor
LATLEIRQDVGDAAVVVAVAGDIDTATVDALVKNLGTALNVASGHRQKLLVVDLNEVTYFGSAGLNAVLGCYEIGRADDVTVRLVASAAEVVRPLQVTQLDAVIRPYPTVADAIAGGDTDGS